MKRIYLFACLLSLSCSSIAHAIQFQLMPRGEDGFRLESANLVTSPIPRVGGSFSFLPGPAGTERSPADRSKVFSAMSGQSVRSIFVDSSPSPRLVSEPSAQATPATDLEFLSFLSGLGLAEHKSRDRDRLRLAFNAIRSNRSVWVKAASNLDRVLRVGSFSVAGEWAYIMSVPDRPRDPLSPELGPILTQQVDVSVEELKYPKREDPHHELRIYVKPDGDILVVYGHPVSSGADKIIYPVFSLKSDTWDMSPLVTFLRERGSEGLGLHVGAFLSTKREISFYRLLESEKLSTGMPVVGLAEARIFELGSGEVLVTQKRYQSDLREVDFQKAQRETTFAAIAFGLSQIHRLGYAHRDIKEANILVDDSGSAVIGDFGSTFNDPKASIPKTTMHYEAPELPIRLMSPSASQDATIEHWQRGDIFSLGLVMLHTLPEARGISFPFSRCEPVMAVPYSDPFNQCMVRESVPFHADVQALATALCRGSPCFAQIVADCLHHNPSERPSAEELARALYLEPKIE